MNTKERAQAAHMDWAIREAVGDSAAPDLLARVRDRITIPSAKVARQPEQPPVSATPTRPRSWLAAAGILLGIATLVAVAASHIGNDALTSAATPQDPQASKPVRTVVRSADELIEVSPDTTHLRVLRITAPDFVRLVPGLPKLEELDLGDFGGARMDTLSAAVLDKISTFTSLRTLHLPGRIELQDAWLKPLTSLPLLQSLNVSHAQIGEQGIAHLASLPALRRLDLSLNQALSDEALRVLIAGVPGLRRLSLAGCGGLTSKGLQQIEALQQLKHLNLGWDVPNDILLDIADPTLANLRVAERVSNAQWNAMSSTPSDLGVDDDVLRALAKIPSLRLLDLSGCRTITSHGFKILTDMPITDLRLANLPKLPESLRSVIPKTVTKLSLERSYVTDASLEQISRMMLLIELRISGCSRVTDRGLGLVLQRHKLFMLSIERCDGLTHKSLQPLLAQKELLELRTTGLHWVDAAAEKQLRALPRLLKLTHHRPR